MSKSLNKSDLVAKVAKNTGQTQVSVDAVLNGMFEVISESIADGTKVMIPGWISIDRSYRAAWTGRNPRTGEKMENKAGYRVKVTPGTKLKAAVAD